MKKILALGGSTSKESINKQFAYFVANQMKGADIIRLDLNDFPLPIYSIDEENDNGLPKDAQNLVKLIKNADGMVLSLAEHNGSFTSAFKNVFDWMSRIDVKVFESTPVFLLSTSPGGRGGESVMRNALDRFPRHGAKIPAHFSLPSFFENYKNGEIQDKELASNLNKNIQLFIDSL